MQHVAKKGWTCWGGTQLIVETDSIPQMMASDLDHKFTVLPFKLASGDAVCCVVIFQSNSGEVHIQWRMGIGLVWFLTVYVEVTDSISDVIVR